MKINKDYIRFTFFYNEKILNTSIDILDLSARASNGLKRSGIKTIGELIENWNRLPNLKQFGKKSLHETRSAIFNYNIEKMSEEQIIQFIQDFRYKSGEEREYEYRENS